MGGQHHPRLPSQLERSEEAEGKQELVLNDGMKVAGKSTNYLNKGVLHVSIDKVRFFKLEGGWYMISLLCLVVSSVGSFHPLRAILKRRL